ncbi:hypothetical protein H4683_003038 [Filibacter limicola]|uniref:Transposase IS4-like domain-containing protein n=1 Tax=Sporosarcina limicola TaxID=34101 RepID=A0A927R5D8_9BACL|nr:hypothetical protein [Sporosarcina limicola]
MFSIILPTNTADVKVMLPLIEMIQKIDGLKVEYLATDLGYFDTNDQRESLMTHDVAVVTEIKKNAVIPQHCDSNGKLECKKGHPLVFVGIDKDTSEV